MPMTTDLEKIDRTQFYVNSGVFCGIPAVLVTPKQMGVDWNYANEIYRSSIWSLEGALLSASLKKFVNFEERPDFHPAPKSLAGCSIIDKVDGSTMICDFVNGQVNARTRGTFHYSTLDNAFDFEYILHKYPNIRTFLAEHPSISLVFEITTPSNKIVINYGEEPDVWLINAINKDTYQYFTQNELDCVSETYGWKRPARYSFDSIAQMIEAVTALEGREGVCLYYKNDQDIRKCKAAKYLILHRMKSELSGMGNIIDMYIDQGCPSYSVLYQYVMETFDFELAEQCKGSLSRIADAYKEVQRILAHMDSFIGDRLRGLSRAEQAKIVIAAYGETNRAGYVLKMLDGKQIDGDGIKKLLLQVLK